MKVTNTPIAVISGPVGVGKSSVGGELSEYLEQEWTPHTFIDFDQLRYTFPRPSDDPWGNRLGLKNLVDVWKNCSQSGSLNLVVAYVVEKKYFLDDIRAAIPGSHIVTFQLAAKTATLEARVGKREIGSGLEWHVQRAAELSEILSQEDAPCDYRITTDDRSVTDIAAEIAGLVDWRGT